MWLLDAGLRTDCLNAFVVLYDQMLEETSHFSNGNLTCPVAQIPEAETTSAILLDNCIYTFHVYDLPIPGSSSIVLAPIHKMKALIAQARTNALITVHPMQLQGSCRMHLNCKRCYNLSVTLISILLQFC